MVGDTEDSIPHSQRALEISRRLGNRRGEAISLHNLALAALWMGDPAKTRERYAQAIQLMADLGDRRGVAYFSVNVSWVDAFQGKLADAASRLDEAGVTLAMLRDTQLIGWAFSHQARLAYLRGDVDSAARTFEEAILLWREVGNGFGIGWTTGHFASAMIAKGDYDRASALLREALVIWKESGSARGHATLCSALIPYTMVTGTDTFRESLIEGLEHLARVRDFVVVMETFDESAPWLPQLLGDDRAAAVLAAARAESERLGRVPAPRYRRDAQLAAGHLQDADDGAPAEHDDSRPPLFALRDVALELADAFRR
jgi:tetratricopeptide (TPR) repeat protein